MNTMLSPIWETTRETCFDHEVEIEIRFALTDAQPLKSSTEDRNLTIPCLAPLPVFAEYEALENYG